LFWQFSSYFHITGMFRSREKLRSTRPITFEIVKKFNKLFTFLHFLVILMVPGLGACCGRANSLVMDRIPVLLPTHGTGFVVELVSRKGFFS
jgi:hypothetical protein